MVSMRSALAVARSHPQLSALALGLVVLALLRLRRGLFGSGTRGRSTRRGSRVALGLVLVGLPAALLVLHFAVGRHALPGSAPGQYSSKIPPLVLHRLPRWAIFLVDHPPVLVSLVAFVVGLLVLFLVTWAKFVFRMARSAVIAYAVASSSYGAWTNYRSAPAGAAASYKVALALVGARRPLVHMALYLVSPVTSFVSHTRIVLAPLIKIVAVQSRVIGFLLTRALWVVGAMKHFAEATIILIGLLTLATVALFDARLQLAEARSELRAAKQQRRAAPED